MCADRSRHPIVHFVGSIPLPDSEIVFRTLSSAVGPHLKRVPDGETGLRKTWINMVPGDRPALLPPLTQHFIGEVAKIAAALPNDRIALQWDVCQEVLAWEGYYEPGPVDFRTETIEVLSRIGNAVPSRIELGYHLCYGSPADEHLVQPKDAGIMVEMANAITAGVT